MGQGRKNSNIYTRKQSPDAPAFTLLSYHDSHNDTRFYDLESDLLLGNQATTKSIVLYGVC
jgi:hypothetical protein